MCISSHLCSDEMPLKARMLPGRCSSASVQFPARYMGTVMSESERRPSKTPKVPSSGYSVVASIRGQSTRLAASSSALRDPSLAPRWRGTTVLLNQWDWKLLMYMPPRRAAWYILHADSYDMTHVRCGGLCIAA